MAEYRDAAVSGSSRVRARALHFENPLSGIPSVWIEEERVTTLGASQVITPCADPMGGGELPQINLQATDLTTAFPLRDPTTGDVIEGQSSSYGALFVLLYSLYWHLAEARDAALP